MLSGENTGGTVARTVGTDAPEIGDDATTLGVPFADAATLGVPLADATTLGVTFAVGLLASGGGPSGRTNGGTTTVATPTAANSKVSLSRWLNKPALRCG
jgi:hypothetical protein